jgi:endonuclease/exonuclease/phosphatase family metal-dependent hydrolase
MDFTVVTLNISAGFLAPLGVPAWVDRKDRLADALRALTPALIALQEVTPPQLADLRARLPGYAALTLPCADPDPALLDAWRAKYARFGLDAPPDPYELAWFYDEAVFTLPAHGHWWLSPTPERPSIGFGNVAPRAVLWARLRPRAASHDLLAFNTHLDHRCLAPMVALCRHKLAAYAEGDTPRLFVGDLNFNPSSAHYAQMLADGWQDSALAAEAGAAQAGTFLYEEAGVPAGRIDHIFYQGAGLRAAGWARLLPPDPAQRFSDHDPVYARLTLAA